MSDRERLPNRRVSELVDFEHGGRARGELRRAFGGVPGIHLSKGALDRERRPHRAFGVVLLRLRIAEKGHQPVAEPLQHMAA
jgi:hypothetical protein